MYETYWKFELPKNQILTLVVDCSESAQVHLNDIQALVKKLINTLPRAYWGPVFFLGSQEIYTIEDLETNMAALMTQHQSRISLFSPIAHRLLSKSLKSQIVIIGNGLIFDLEDWLDKFDFHLFRLGQDHLTLAPELKEYSQLQFDEALTEIENHPIKISIEFPNSMPCYWNNPQFRWQKPFLVIDAIKAKNELNLEVKILAKDDITPTAHIENMTQKIVKVDLTRMQGASIVSGWDHLRLTPPEEKAYWQMKPGLAYDCPVCNGKHVSSEVYCEQRNEWGSKSIVFPSLQKLGVKKGIFLFQENSDCIEVALSPCNVLQLSQHQVIIQEGNHFMRYEYSMEKSDWMASPDSFKGLRSVDGNRTGLCL